MLLVEGELVVRFELEVVETSAPTILSQTCSANVKRRERSCSVFLRGIVKKYSGKLVGSVDTAGVKGRFRFKGTL